jgi:hypothetical protein
VLLGLDWKRLALAALGGAPGAAWLAYYNHTLYGGALRSGYGAIHDAFAVHYVAPTLAHFGYWLAVMMPAALLLLPFIALWRQRSRELWALLLWFGAITGLYAFYEVSHEVWWCLRFILPGIPALILAGLLALKSWTPRLRAATAAGLAAWAIACSFYWMPRQHVFLMKDYEQVYRDACVEARRLFPPEALVAAFLPSGAVYHYTDFPVLRWDSISSGEFDRFAGIAGQAGRPIYAMLFDGIEDRAWHEHLTGEWTRVGGVKNLSFWRFVRPATGAEGK